MFIDSAPSTSESTAADEPIVESIQPGKSMTSAKARWAIAGFVILALVGLGIVVVYGLPPYSSSAKPESHTLLGAVALYTSDGFSQGDCSGTGGYSDLFAGTPVVVKDGAGKTVATGSLSGGRAGKAGATSGRWNNCVFGFIIDDIPEADFYSVEVSHRGALTYSMADLEATAKPPSDDYWRVTLTIGSKD